MHGEAKSFIVCTDQMETVYRIQWCSISVLSSEYGQLNNGFAQDCDSALSNDWRTCWPKSSIGYRNYFVIIPYNLDQMAKCLNLFIYLE